MPPEPDFLRLFRGDRYRFELGVRPTAWDWFRLAPPGTLELAERCSLLTTDPERHAPWRDDAGPVMDELLDLLGEPAAKMLIGGGAAACRRFGGLWEPDFVLMRRDETGGFRMVGGCVCDPSWWDPVGKLGLPVEAIHDPVPTLNRDLGPRIKGFLSGLAPDRIVTRENWGLAAVPDRNLHPALHRPRLTADTSIDRAWLRVEHQAFRALPRTDGLVFVIWLTVHPMSDVTRDSGVASAFRQMLATMPEDIAMYKGLNDVRSSWLAELE